MKKTFTTSGTCSRFIDFELDGEIIKEVKFIGGCTGNTSGLARLVQGMSVSEVVERLKGTVCRGNTSCPDQLAKALEEHCLKQAS